MCLKSLRGRRDRAKLKWWYKCLRIDTQNNYSVGNGKLSLVEVDKGKHEVEWLMNSLFP